MLQTNDKRKSHNIFSQEDKKKQYPIIIKELSLDTSQKQMINHQSTADYVF